MARARTSKQNCWVTPASPEGWNDDAFYAAALNVASSCFLAIVRVEANQEFGSFWRTHATKPWQGKGSPRRVFVLWQGPPVDPVAMLSWRSALIEEGQITYRIEMNPSRPEGRDWETWFHERLGSWLTALPDREATGMLRGQLVTHRPVDFDHGVGGYDPAFLTILPGGSMSPVLDALDECKRMFREAIGQEVGERRREVSQSISQLLAFDPQGVQADRIAEQIELIQSAVGRAVRTNRFVVDRRCLPRVLLLGPSGVGKTLVARYLAWRTSPGDGEVLLRPFKRLPIPEYLGDEQRFEYDVFGHTKGAFTGARESGSNGFLLERMGGVVFFDEIGEASPAIQSKLLAYLDDYQVTPRGWVGEPIECPMLVVAATNRPIDQWAEQQDQAPGSQSYFRNDLFRRFNAVVHIPPLNDRRSEIPFVLDAMLQMEEFNPRGVIREVGKEALKEITRTDFERGNFRTLEDMIRTACSRATTEGRRYLVRGDLSKRLG